MDEFTREYKCTEKGSEDSAFKIFQIDLFAGVYNEGLFQVLADGEGSELKKIRGGNILPLIRTGICDYFYYNYEDKLFYYTSLEENFKEDITDNAEVLLNVFLVLDEVQENIMSKSMIDHCIIKYGALSFDEVFVLSPLKSLGGDPMTNDFNITTAEVFVELMISLKE